MSCEGGSATCSVECDIDVCEWDWASQIEYVTCTENPCSYAASKWLMGVLQCSSIEDSDVGISDLQASSSLLTIPCLTSITSCCIPLVQFFYPTINMQWKLYTAYLNCYKPYGTLYCNIILFFSLHLPCTYILCVRERESLVVCIMFSSYLGIYKNC